MMKNYACSLLCFALLISCKTELVVLDNFEGTVINRATNEPISGVKIYVDSFAINSFTPIVTVENGYFITHGITLSDNDKGYQFRKNMSYQLIFQSSGYVRDTIDLISFGDGNQTLDTINLGNIYLTPLEEN